MTRQAVNLGESYGLPYSSAIVANGFVFVSGCVGRDAEGKIIEGIEAQTRQVMEELKAILEKAGSSLDKVVKSTIFLADRGDFDAMNKVYASFFSGAPPARATIAVGLMLEGLLVEIEMIAVL